MNKKLLAIAIAGVLAAPLAQAQTANVTLYGRINVDTEVLINAKQDVTGGSIKQNLYRVQSNSSRFGIRGSESLGGGLNAIFQIENGSLGITNSGGLLAGRDTFVGLQGGWGTMKIGYFLTPYDDPSVIFGSVPTFITSILGSQSLWSNSGWVGNTQTGGAFDDRASASVRYDTPNYKGFTGSFQVSGANSGADSGAVTLGAQRRHASLYSVNGMYNNGPFKAGLAYEQRNNYRGNATAGGPRLTDQGWYGTAGWDFGIVYVGAVYEQLKYDIETGGDLKRNLWGLGASGNLGPGQYYLGYQWAGDGTGSSKNYSSFVGAVKKGDGTGAQWWTVSYTYPLSKRTLMYAGYVMIQNESNGQYNFAVGAVPGLCNGAQASTATGAPIQTCGNSARPQGLLAGLVHNF